MKMIGVLTIAAILLIGVVTEGTVAAAAAPPERPSDGWRVRRQTSCVGRQAI